MTAQSRNNTEKCKRFRIKISYFDLYAIDTNFELGNHHLRRSKNKKNAVINF